jgi:hypothetical protein
LDWADELLDDPSRATLRARIAAAVARQRRETRRQLPPDTNSPLGWLPAAEYQRLAPAAFEEHVCVPLRERGLLDD